MDYGHITSDIAVNTAYITTNYILNSFSILVSSLLTITIFILRVKEVKFSNRISIRLLMYVSIMGIFFSLSHMLRVNFYKWISYLSSWGYIFSSITICSLIMSILINIQLTITYNYQDVKNYYTLISFSIATILSVLPITFGKFNFDQERNYFWFDTAIWEWSTYTGWITFTILYCIISMILMFHRLNEDSRIISYNLAINSTTTTLSNISERSKIISKYIFRITLYSLIPALSYFPSIISYLAHYSTNEHSFFLNLLSLISESSQSIFILIIFLFDPIIDEAISERKRINEHKQHVLDNIKKGVYVDNIELELPSNRDQNCQQQQNNNKTRSYARSTIYGYAKNAKDRISTLTSALYNRKKIVDAKKSVINFDNEEDDILLHL